MSNYCKIEFYFKAEQMLELLNKNPKAKGIIIKQEIKPRKNADGKGFTNVTTITAYAKGGGGSRSVEMDAATGEDSAPIDGCPYPPGCDTDN